MSSDTWYAGAHAIQRIGTEVLDAERTVVGTQFEIFGLDAGRFYGAPRDLGLDDRRFTLRLFRNDFGRSLVAAVEPATAAKQRGG